MRVLLLVLISTLSFAQSDYPEKLETNSDIIGHLLEKHEQGEVDFIQFFQLKALLNDKDLGAMERALLESIEIELTNSKNFNPVHFDSLTKDEAVKYLSHEGFLNNDHIRFSSFAKMQLKANKKRLTLLSNNSVTPQQKVIELLNARDLLHFYNEGEYRDSVQVFLFCRQARAYPCLFVMKDKLGRFVRNTNGSLWTLPALAKSKRDIPFYQTNGQTPTGVHSIDSVMPEANRPTVFGKYRRLILNWIPKTSDGESVVDLLPRTHINETWWQPASIARDAGRKYLRIHGTGRINQDPNSSFFPHVPTSGCVSTREGKYGNKMFKDQRVILDKLMQASQLAPVYSNEVKLKGMLYVINIDQKKAPVRLRDLRRFGLR